MRALVQVELDASASEGVEGGGAQPAPPFGSAGGAGAGELVIESVFALSEIEVEPTS